MSNIGEGRHGVSRVESVLALLRQLERDHTNLVMAPMYRRSEDMAPRPDLRHER